MTSITDSKFYCRALHVCGFWGISSYKKRIWCKFGTESKEAKGALLKK